MATGTENAFQVAVPQAAIGTPQYVTPLTGATVNVAAGQTRIIIDPAGTLAALTLNFPPTPSDGQLLYITSSQIVTTLTVTGATLVGALAALAAAAGLRYVYSLTANKWFPA